MAPRSARAGHVIARTLAVAGGAGLLVAAAGCHRRSADATAPGEALKVVMGKSTKLDPEAALRCFVHGQFVGMQTPAGCAQKNGIAPGALDVGLDQSGALAAGARDTPLQPLTNATVENATGPDDQVAEAGPDTGPNSGPNFGPGAANPQQPPDDGGDAATDQAGGGQLGDCQGFGRAGWRPAGRGVTLNACVLALYDGRCVGPGQALYGRWGGKTLRLVTGRVGVSSDNRTFHPLVAQDPDDCSISPD